MANRLSIHGNGVTSTLIQIDRESSSTARFRNYPHIWHHKQPQSGTKANIVRSIHRLIAFYCGVDRTIKRTSRCMVATCSRSPLWLTEVAPQQSVIDKSRGLILSLMSQIADKKAESSKEAVNDWLALALTPPDALLMGYGITEYLYCWNWCSLHHKDDKDRAWDWWLRIKGIFR